MGKLKQLGVEYCGVGPRGLTEIAKYVTSLEYLHIDGNQMDEQVAEAIASNLKQLKSFEASNTGLTENMLLRIAELPNLYAVYACNRTHNIEQNGLGESTKKAVKQINRWLDLSL